MVIPKLLDQEGDKKLFFFYSMEAPQVQKPGPVRLYRMPTALERRGDFSQTFDANGRLMFIKDPLSSGACNVTTGGPGCFPGNVIPPTASTRTRWRCSNTLPLPNVPLTGPGSGALSNFTRQETPDNPRMNNLLRIDGRPSGSNSYWFSCRQFSSNQFGSEITAGPAKWGFFNGNYVSGRQRHQRRLEPRLQVGGGEQSSAPASAAPPKASACRTTATSPGSQRSAVGFTSAQFHPELNPQGLLPFVRFGLNTTGIDTPDFTYDSRIGSTAYDWLASVRDNITWTHDRHTFKAGGHFEYMQNNEARGGNWAGDITFSNNTSNPLNTNFAFCERRARRVLASTETDKFRETQNRQWWSEWYLQDTWQTTPRITLRLRRAVPLVFAHSRGRTVRSPTSIRRNTIRRRRRGSIMPAIVNGTRVAFDPVTGQSLNAIFIGAFVPGTGDEANGMVKETDPSVPGGFRERARAADRAAARLHLGPHGRRHHRAALERRLLPPGAPRRRIARQPRRQPAVHPQSDRLLQHAEQSVRAGRHPARTGRRRSKRSKRRRRRRARSTGRSACAREIGWGTAVDATYSGYNVTTDGDVSRPERRARRRAIHRSHSGQPRSDRAGDRRADGGGAARGVPAAVPRLSEHPRPAATSPTPTTSRCRCR